MSKKNRVYKLGQKSQQIKTTNGLNGIKNSEGRMGVYSTRTDTPELRKTYWDMMLSLGNSYHGEVLWLPKSEIGNIPSEAVVIGIYDSEPLPEEAYSRFKAHHLLKIRYDGSAWINPYVTPELYNKFNQFLLGVCEPVLRGEEGAKYPLIVVHCGEGLIRSPAVAEFICYWNHAYRMNSKHPACRGSGAADSSIVRALLRQRDECKRNLDKQFAEAYHVPNTNAAIDEVLNARIDSEQLSKERLSVLNVTLKETDRAVTAEEVRAEVDAILSNTDQHVEYSDY